MKIQIVVIRIVLANAIKIMKKFNVKPMIQINKTFPLDKAVNDLF